MHDSNLIFWNFHYVCNIIRLETSKKKYFLRSYLSSRNPNLFRSFFSPPLEGRSGFFTFICLNQIQSFSFNKVVYFTRYEFSFNFPLFSYIFVTDFLQRIVVGWFLSRQFGQQHCFDQTEKSHQNPCSSICFIKPRILDILGILGLPLM